MGKVVGYRYVIQWRNPYRPRPADAPFRLTEMFETVEQRRARMARGEPAIPPDFAAQVEPGGPYGLFVEAVQKPGRAWTQGQRARRRRANLERRVRRKWPLFADEIIAEELSRRPDYFAGLDAPEREAARAQALANDETTYRRFLISIGEKYE